MSFHSMRALLLGAAALVGTELASAQGYRPEVGERHPDFTLPLIGSGDPGGPRQAVSLSQYRGKKVLLIQFASW